MTQEGRVPRRAAGAAAVMAVMAGLLVATGAGPALAATAVSAVNGSAFGYETANIALFGGAQTPVGPTPTVALASDASNSPQSASATTGVVAYGPATLFTSDAITLQASGSLGPAGSVTSTSTVTDINKATTQKNTGSEALTADSISATCSASGSGTSGSTTVTNGTLVTDNSATPPTTVAVPTNPSPNTSVNGSVTTNGSTDTFTDVFNEQTTDASGNLVVNAVHEYFHGPTLTGNLIIGQVVCGVTTLPGTDVSLQNPGITHSPDPAPAGGSVTFTITVTNLGPNDAPSVSDLTSVTGGRVASVTSSAGTCSQSKGKIKDVTCALGTITSGSAVTVQLTVSAPHKSGSTISISSTASSPADTNPSNNTATGSVLVQ